MEATTENAAIGPGVSAADLLPLLQPVGSKKRMTDLAAAITDRVPEDDAIARFRRKNRSRRASGKSREEMVAAGLLTLIRERLRQHIEKGIVTVDGVGDSATVTLVAELGAVSAETAEQPSVEAPTPATDAVMRDGGSAEVHIPAEPPVEQPLAEAVVPAPEPVADAVSQANVAAAPATEPTSEPPAPPMTITLGSREFSVLFPEIMRRPTPEERAVLAASIRRHGVKVPILVDEDHGVIDGLTRLEIAEELGLEAVPCDYCPAGLDLQAKAALALELNDARRHLAPGERKDISENRQSRIEQAVALRQQGMSLREIAARTGSTKSQVDRDLKGAAATVPGGTVEPPGGVVTGLDGKKRAAAVPRQPEELQQPDGDEYAGDDQDDVESQATKEHAPGEEDEDDDEDLSEDGPLDPQLSQPGPVAGPSSLGERLSAELPGWERARELMTELRTQLQKIADGEGGRALRKRAKCGSKRFEPRVRFAELWAALRECRPAATDCPLCGGRDASCALCDGSNWLSSNALSALTAEQKREVRLIGQSRSERATGLSRTGPGGRT